MLREAPALNTYPDLAAPWTSLMLRGPDRFLDSAVGMMGTALTGVSRKPTLGYTNDKLSWNTVADEGLACQLPETRSERKWFKSTGLFARQLLSTSWSTQISFDLIYLIITELICVVHKKKQKSNYQTQQHIQSMIHCSSDLVSWQQPSRNKCPSLRLTSSRSAHSVCSSRCSISVIKTEKINCTN